MNEAISRQKQIARITTVELNVIDFESFPHA